MNKRILIIFFLLLPFFSIANLPNKRAIIIAIGKYLYWNPLASVKDHELVKKALIKQKFLAQNITSIIDEKATKSFILEEMKRFIENSKKGDIIVIHFAGHGQQIIDDNNDEILDKLDEAIVPYDAPQYLTKTYSGEKLIRDDQIGLWINELKLKVGFEGHILLVLDSCHSGTASKGTAQNRGSVPPIINSKESKLELVQESGSGYFDSSFSAFKAKGNEGKFIMFSASGASLSNKETTTPDGISVGSLSFSISESLEMLSMDETYETLFRKISKIMVEKVKQIPIMEGDSKSKLFNSYLTPKESIYTITKFYEEGKAFFRLSAGYLKNIYYGTVLGFAPTLRNNKSIEKPKIRGTVIKSDAFESILEVTDDVPEKETEFTGIVVEQTFGDYKIEVSFGKFNDLKLLDNLKKQLSGKKIISISSKNNELKIVEKENSIEIYQESDGELYAKVAKLPYIENGLTEILMDYARAKVIRNLEVENGDFKAEINLRPAILAQMEDKTIPTFIGDINNSFTKINTSQQAWFTIKNIGKKDFYFTLLDIQPDGIINILMPNETYKNEGKKWGEHDVYLRIGEEKGFPIKKISPPYGNEMFKVLLSSQYEDFSFLKAGNRSKISEYAPKQNESPLEKLLKDLTDGSMERTKGTIPNVGGTASFIFQITK